MRRINHITWSFALSLWIYYYLFEFNLAETVVLSFFTSLIAFLPDIDIKIVNWSRKMMYGSFFILFPVYLFCRIVFKHRTITHSLWIPMILFWVYHVFNLNFVLGGTLLILAMAISLHIFEDSLTISGVRPFYPFSLKIRLGKFSTSSSFDFIVLEAISFIMVILFIVVLFL